MSVGEHDRLKAAPDEARRMWREHWGLFAASVDERLAVLVHMTADPARREGVFTVIAWVDGRRYQDIHRAPSPAHPDGRTRIESPRLTFEIAEPGRRCAIRYRGAGIEADLEYVTRFEGYHFVSGAEHALYPVENAQQSVAVTGEIRLQGDDGLPGEVRAFDGFGSRDHSWGWFPDILFRHHEWVAVSLADSFMQMSRTRWRSNDDHREGGFAATLEGVVPLSQIVISEPYWLSDPDAHMPALDRDVECSAVDSEGGRYSVELLLSRATARHHMNRRDRELDRLYQQVTLFCPVRVGDQHAGTAVVEFGKLLERPGICDEPIPGVPDRSGAAS
jgi:hypothetical protein